jgi:hypothetical protein
LHIEAAHKSVNATMRNTVARDAAYRFSMWIERFVCDENFARKPVVILQATVDNLHSVAPPPKDEKLTAGYENADG